MLRELGSRVVPACAALDTSPDGRTTLVVLERVARGATYGDQEIADWVRDARRLATLEHPNVARIRDVVIRGEEVYVVGEFVDGVRWSELVASQPRVSLELSLRVLVDVLSGLSAVHNLRDAKREPLKLVHGELTPDCVVVGLDGVARIVSTCRVHSATARPGRDGSAYLAPEVLLADETADARADVYSAGVMLWEALSGRPLFPNTQPSAIVTHLLSGKVQRATIPEGSAWAAPLAEVASRALSADPEKRFLSAAALAADVRRIAGAKLAAPVRVAAFVRATFGDAVQARRAELERGEVRVRTEVSGVVEPPAEPPSVDIPVDTSPATISTAPTPIPPSPDALAAARAAPVLHVPPAPPVPKIAPAPEVAPPAPAPAPPAPPAPPVRRTLARVAPKPPTVPNMRPRQSTLAGVAPPASLPKKVAEEDGTPVVVPPSDPPPRPVIAKPTPLVAFDVPKAARPSAEQIATDIAAALQVSAPAPASALASAPAPAPPPSPVVAVAMPPAFPAPPAPPVVLPLPVGSPLTTFAPSLDEAIPPPKPRRARLVALLAGPLLFGTALIIWWLMARPATSADTRVPPGTEATVSAAAVGVPPPAPTGDTPSATGTSALADPASGAPSAAASVEVAPSTVSAPPQPAATPTGAATAPPETASTATSTAGATSSATPRPIATAPQWPPPPPYTPPSAVRPNKRKYEPEGI
ncbi:MAG: protein kinase [Polyangiaceae bacterium]